MDCKSPTRYEYAQSQLAGGAFIYFEVKILSVVELSFITVKHAVKKNGE